MRLPIEIEQYLENRAGELGVNKLIAVHNELSAGYRSWTECSEKILREESALAYAIARMPATGEALLYVLRELQLRLPYYQPRSWIDFGAGPGTSAWAAGKVYPNFEKLVLFERSPALMELGQRLLSRSDFPSEKFQWIGRDICQLSNLPESDLAIFSYSMAELDAGSSERLLAAIAGSVETVVIVEPGTPSGYRNILKVREFFLSKSYDIIAPCPHRMACPLEGAEWCHFSVRLERSSLHRKLKGDLGYEDEKFSYLIVSKQHNVDRQSRLISVPRRTKPAMILDLCTKEGKRESLSIWSRDRSNFKRAVKLKWGDVYSGNR